MNSYRTILVFAFILAVAAAHLSGSRDEVSLPITQMARLAGGTSGFDKCCFYDADCLPYGNGTYVAQCLGQMETDCSTSYAELINDGDNANCEPDLQNEVCFDDDIYGCRSTTQCVWRFTLGMCQADTANLGFASRVCDHTSGCMPPISP